MRVIKFILIGLLCQIMFCLPVKSGDIEPGSVPGEIIYQGRLEKDNAPITGPVYITFRIYDALTAGNLKWTSSEMKINAVQGIFSAVVAPPWSVFSKSDPRYLEVQIQGDTLSPREQFQSTVYSLLAKKLEDGASVSVSSFTSAFQVLLATTSGNVGIGTNSPDKKLVVNGDIRIMTGGTLYLQDGTPMTTANIGSQGNISNPSDAIITSDNNDSHSGDIIFKTGTLAGNEKMRISTNGYVGIGAASPIGKLDVDGSLFVGDEGIYDRDDDEINIKEDLIVEGGRITGANSEFISVGETNDIIALTSGGLEKMRIHSDGNVGIGITNPSANLHVNSDILSDSGVRGGIVSIGAYTGWSSAVNEIRASDGSHLLLQQNNTSNVGIGLTAPTEKLHVHGSIKANNGIIASTAAFSGNVSVFGDLVANNPLGSKVELSSTVIYGTLLVTGGIGTEVGESAYLGSTQTFTAENTFLNQITVSSNIISSGRIGAGVIDFDFPGAKYLQIGDNQVGFADDDALAYLVAGSGPDADSKIYFNRGANEAARLETQGANNLAIIADNSVKALIDSSNFKIFNSAVYISTGENTTPAIYVNPTTGNVGMGTSIPTQRLTVDGNIRIASGGALIFPDGTSMTTSSATSATSLSNNDDVLIQAGVDGSGNVIIDAGGNTGLFIKSDGKIGIGTQNPVAKVHIRGGDLILGNTSNPYPPDNGIEDLIIAGGLVVDGGIIQRSAELVELSGLSVSGNVYLSTGAAAKTGIGTGSPAAKFDVEGNAQFGQGANKSTFTAAGALQLATQLTVPNGGTGATSLTSGGILYGNGAGAIGNMGVLTNGQLLIGDGSGAPAAATLTGTINQVNIAEGAGSITLSLPQSIDATATPTFGSLTLSSQLTVANGGTGVTSLTSGGILYGAGAGAIGATGVLTNGQLLIGDGSNAPTAATLTGTVNQVNIAEGAGSITLSLPQNIHTGATPTFAGLNISALGTVNMNTTGKITNLAEPSANQDAATKNYVDSVTGGGAGSWGLRGNNINDASDFIGTTGSGDDLVFKTVDSERMRITADGIIEFNNALDVLYGGTGATTATGARNNLGLGTIATQASNNVSITGGDISGITDLAIADGGTGANTQGGAQSNLNVPGLGTAAVDYVVCLKAAGPPAVLGYCTDINTTTGACTCN